jgi:hypothetical protein
MLNAQSKIHSLPSWMLLLQFPGVKEQIKLATQP